MNPNDQYMCTRFKIEGTAGGCMVYKENKDYDKCIIDNNCVENKDACKDICKPYEVPLKIDLTCKNPYSFTNGANNITVVGDPKKQKCTVQYSDVFDSGSFHVDTDPTRRTFSTTFCI